MSTERAPKAREDGAREDGAREDGVAPKPTGLRRLTPGLLEAERIAAGFAGLPERVSAPGQLLAAFKEAAPRLGLSVRLAHALDWLFRFTRAQDWAPGARPIVWPSAAMQADALGLSPTQVKAINRRLIEAGLVAVKDSPNGKRYGKRDGQGRIVEAYGFDLSPLAVRHAEFVRLAEEARAEREARRQLRRRATIARNGIAQILETAAEYGFAGEEWAALLRDGEAGHRAVGRAETVEAMAAGVQGLERRQGAARERLASLLAAAPKESVPVDSDPERPQNRPHQYTYHPDLDPDRDTVMAAEERNGAAAAASAPATRAGERPAPARLPAREAVRLGAAELVGLAPRLGAYVHGPAPSWRDVVDAADWLRRDLGVSASLWGEACLALGREQAALALAIVSAKPAEHFRTTPGGYFRGMLAKAEAGELHLTRTIWALRADKARSAGRIPKRAARLERERF